MKIALLGYGKMGKTIERLALQEGHEIVLKINRENTSSFNIENLRNADVAIEFSTPQSVVQNILTCFEAGIPVIVGTTAWSDYKSEIEQRCKTSGGTMLSASNFSLGVNIFFELNSKLAQLMSNYLQYKISITEIHHTAKLDAPSGTAITLAESLIENNINYRDWKNETTLEKNVIPIESHREPDVPGTHIVKYASPEDIIEIKHTAINREGFAKGAILAAHWIIGKKGVFSMRDLLDFDHHKH
jgi:4-hydroxy-tetrahydrodipicolinate reductase